ncbi:MAG: glycine cleavage system protein T, partial [Thermoplasmata archaeon]
DTLRLEKGFLLSGQDFNENRSTVETGWDFIVDWDHEFVGKDVLLRQKSEGVDEQLFGVEMKGSGVPRRGSEVVKEGEKIGTVTSGTYSPTLRRGIALAYIKSSEIIEGSEIAVRIRNKEYEAILKKPPFV